MKTETEKHFKKIKTFNNSLIMKPISFLNTNDNLTDVNFIVLICYTKPL